MHLAGKTHLALQVTKWNCGSHFCWPVWWIGSHKTNIIRCGRVSPVCAVCAVPATLVQSGEKSLIIGRTGQLQYFNGTKIKKWKCIISGLPVGLVFRLTMGWQSVWCIDICPCLIAAQDQCVGPAIIEREIRSVAHWLAGHWPEHTVSGELGYRDTQD